MPVLPSGRRVEFSLDRFHAMLRQIGRRDALKITEKLQHPDDLLFVLDAVHFSIGSGQPFFADYVAADWLPYAAEWPNGDREALSTWLASEAARRTRAEAVDYVKALALDHGNGHLRYPYTIPGVAARGVTHEGPRLRQ